MHRRQIERCLSGMSSRSANGGQQQRTAGDGLHSGPRFGRATVPTPPVVDQRHRASAGLAAPHILRRKAAPAPLVLQLVEAVLLW